MTKPKTSHRNFPRKWNLIRNWSLHYYWWTNWCQNLSKQIWPQSVNKQLTRRSYSRSLLINFSAEQTQRHNRASFHQSERRPTIIDQMADISNLNWYYNNLQSWPYWFYLTCVKNLKVFSRLRPPPPPANCGKHHAPKHLYDKNLVSCHFLMQLCFLSVMYAWGKVDISIYLWSYVELQKYEIVKIFVIFIKLCSCKSHKSTNSNKNYWLTYHRYEQVNGLNKKQCVLSRTHCWAHKSIFIHRKPEEPKYIHENDKARWRLKNVNTDIRDTVQFQH